jgi:hypothetical protein
VLELRSCLVWIVIGVTRTMRTIVLSLLTLTTLLSVRFSFTSHANADCTADGVMAQGGYSTTIRTNDRFVFAIPEELASEDAAPMLCAGLTVYSPMVRNNVGPGKKIGIVGIGGLGRESILFSWLHEADKQTSPSCLPKPSEPRLSYSPTPPTRRTTV